MNSVVFITNKLANINYTHGMKPVGFVAYTLAKNYAWFNGGSGSMFNTSIGAKLLEVLTTGDIDEFVERVAETAVKEFGNKLTELDVFHAVILTINKQYPS